MRYITIHDTKSEREREASGYALTHATFVNTIADRLRMALTAHPTITRDGIIDTIALRTPRNRADAESAYITVMDYPTSQRGRTHYPMDVMFLIADMLAVRADITLS